MFLGAAGVEPTWPCGQRILSPSRLPIPPRARESVVVAVVMESAACRLPLRSQRLTSRYHRAQDRRGARGNLRVVTTAQGASKQIIRTSEPLNSEPPLD